MADLGSSLASVLQVPGLQELLNNAITTQRQQMPLRTAVNQQAANMLPNSAFAGQRPNMASIAPANYNTPAPSSGSILGSILPYLLAGGGGFALGKLLGGGGNGSGGGGNGAGGKFSFGGNTSLAGAIGKLFGLGGSNNFSPAGGTSVNGVPLNADFNSNIDAQGNQGGSDSGGGFDWSSIGMGNDQSVQGSSFDGGQW